MECLACGSNPMVARKSWVLECRACGFEHALLTPRLDGDSSFDPIDETAREHALRALRARNFRRVLEFMANITDLRGITLVDVGCAHGWFLDAAREMGLVCSGVEPDRAMAALARESGHVIWEGVFPDAIPEGRIFDVIAFNDVFEHLPDPTSALKHCAGLLSPRGLLVLVLPSSGGIIYRLSRLLDRFGLSSPHDRMWQKDFPSPHISYFNADNLAKLAKQSGFSEVVRSSLPTIEYSGLWSRIRYDRNAGWLRALTLFVGVATLIPFLRLGPSDTTVQIFRRTT